MAYTSPLETMNGWDGASFRDRKGRIYHLHGRVFRTLSAAGLANWRAFASHPLAAELMAEAVLITTREVTSDSPALGPGPLLEHTPIPFVSYAFEWPFSMLKRAALLHLHLLQRLLPAGFILADATPSNIMFRGISPVFIDTASIVRYQPGDAWRGFKQFLETMLYPLLLAAHKGIPYHAWLRGSGEDGLPVSQVARMFGWHDVLRSGVLGHVKLSSATERLARDAFDVTANELRTTGVPTSVLLRNITKLERIVRGLESKTTPPEWMHYDGDAGYGSAAHERKRAAVEEVAVRLVPRGSLVWDFGCSTGEYSFLLARYTDLVVAMDQESAVVEEMSRRCEAKRIDNVLPLVIDITNPSPAQGWRGMVRRSLSERGRPDLILALALLHHLVLTKNVPVDQIVAELARIGRSCLPEYIAPGDPLAQRLARNAGDGRNELPEQTVFEELASRHFRIQRTIRLNDTRTLYALEAGEYD